MERKFSLLAAVLIAVALAGSTALALEPLGSPTARQKQGQFRVGFDYSLTEMDIRASRDNRSEIFKNVESNLSAVSIAYGLTDSWETFVRLGAANAQFDNSDRQQWNFDGDKRFLWGLGSKITWAQQDDLAWGALFQMHWLNSKDERSGILMHRIGDVPWKETLELDMLEIQIAAGPVWKITSEFSIYGGPFLHIIGGNFNWDYREAAPLNYHDSTSADFKHGPDCGGYLGAMFDIYHRFSAYCEFQFAGDASAFATGLGWKF